MSAARPCSLVSQAIMEKAFQKNFLRANPCEAPGCLTSAIVILTYCCDLHPMWRCAPLAAVVNHNPPVQLWIGLIVNHDIWAMYHQMCLPGQGPLDDSGSFVHKTFKRMYMALSLPAQTLMLVRVEIAAASCATASEDRLFRKWMTIGDPWLLWYT